ncbi:enoyl-CoA hydratase/isomerase family protein [Paraburkholderia graminis]|uniref:enoyl-CoA hydratase/isomerase family protein n=1 Tax=Paraburkholderia graminis TaxID=60548 RepID=UPI0038BBF2AA
MEAAVSHVIVDRRDDVLWITVNRPEKANAMTVAMVEQISEAIVAGGEDPAIRAVLLTGAGERLFTAGVDIREKPQDGDVARQRERRSRALAALQDAVIDAPKPVVVVLNGAAIGGGAMLALLADACVAVDTAELALPEIDLGIATYSGANILATIGGRALALDLIQTGRRMPASEAMSRGLLQSVSSRDGLKSAAISVAANLGGKDVAAFADNKRWINRALKTSLAEAREEHARHRARAAQ